MSQNPVAIPTTTPLPGMSLVEDLNLAMDSLSRWFSGTTAPTSSGLGLSGLAGVPWHDTANNLLKIRDQADTTWITMGTFNETTKTFTAAGTAGGNQLTGVKGNTIQIGTALTIAAGATALTVVGASFVASDVGKAIQVPGAGASGATLITTIAGWTSATTINLAAGASTALAAVAGAVTYGTDDTAALNAAFSQGGIIQVPAGIYLYGSGTGASAAALLLTTPNTWVQCDPHAVFIFNSTLAGTTGICLSANRVRWSGGVIKGCWNTATQGTTSVGNSTDGTIQMAIRPMYYGSVATADISDIWVDGVQFTMAGGLALETALGGASSQYTYRNVRISACNFLQNYRHVMLMGPNSTTTAVPQGIVFTDNVLNITADAGQIYHDGSGNLVGGDAVNSNGVIDGLFIQRNFFGTCGRMQMELYQPGGTAYAVLNLRVKDNYFVGARYRIWSFQVVNGRFEGNVLNAANASTAEWIEYSGADLSFVGNKFIGTGIVTDNGWYASGICTNSGFEVIGNEFWDVPGQSPVPLALLYLSNVTVRDNRIYIGNTPASTMSGAYIFGVALSSNVVFENNYCKLSVGAPYYAGIFSYNRIQFGTCKYNTAEYAGVSGAQDAGFPMFALDGVSVSGNKVLADGVIVWNGDGALLQPNNVNNFWKRSTTNGTTWTITSIGAAAAGVLSNTPPTTPLTTQTYITGDSPTGAWASNPRCFATWSGTAWTFSSQFNNVFLYDTNASAGAYSTRHFPMSGAAGDCQLLTNGGWMRCRVEDNDFAVSGSIKDSGGRTGIVFGSYGASGCGGPVWNCQFLDNVDNIRTSDLNFIFRATVRMLPSYTIPTDTSNHLCPGAVVPSLNPPTGAPNGWRLSNYGASSTWVAF